MRQERTSVKCPRDSALLAELPNGQDSSALAAGYRLLPGPSRIETRALIGRVGQVRRATVAQMLLAGAQAMSRRLPTEWKMLLDYRLSPCTSLHRFQIGVLMLDEQLEVSMALYALRSVAAQCLLWAMKHLSNVRLFVLFVTVWTASLLSRSLCSSLCDFFCDPSTTLAPNIALISMLRFDKNCTLIKV